MYAKHCIGEFEFTNISTYPQTLDGVKLFEGKVNSSISELSTIRSGEHVAQVYRDANLGVRLTARLLQCEQCVNGQPQTPIVVFEGPCNSALVKAAVDMDEVIAKRGGVNRVT